MTDNIINVNNLTKQFIKGNIVTTVINEITFQLSRGDFVSIVGASGSGKSTLLYLLGGLMKPTVGSIIIEDQDLSDMDDSAISNFRNGSLGFIFQSFNLIPNMTCLANTILPFTFSKRKVLNKEVLAEKILTNVGLADKAKNKPSELSGGEQQRVCIARALINDPKIILADEPTGNLDSKNGHAIMNLLAELNEAGKTIIVVTHDEKMAAYTRKKIKLSDGKILGIE